MSTALNAKHALTVHRALVAWRANLRGMLGEAADRRDSECCTLYEERIAEVDEVLAILKSEGPPGLQWLLR